jgi:hypothetical protein
VAERYERLRQAAFSPSADVVAGFGIVIGRGVSAWVCVSSAAADEPCSPPAGHRPGLPSDDIHTDIVRVWAQMALAGMSRR